MTYLAAAYYVGALAIIVVAAVRAHNKLFGEESNAEAGNDRN